MNPAALTPGQRAHVDQVLALVNEVERAWPYNQNLMASSEVERVVLERVADEWPDMRDDRCYLLWANGRMVEVALPDGMVITATALATAPTYGECDTCRCLKPFAGIAVIAVPRNLVPLVLCWDCADHLNPESLLQIGVTDA